LAYEEECTFKKNVHGKQLGFFCQSELSVMILFKFPRKLKACDVQAIFTAQIKLEIYCWAQFWSAVKKQHGYAF